MSLPHPDASATLARLQADMARLLRAMQQPRDASTSSVTGAPRPSSYAAGLPRPTRTRRSPLARLHQHAKAKRRTQRRLSTAGSLRLDAEQEAWEAEERAARYPVGHFGPQHGLTPAQAWEAQQLLNRANRLRPLRGRHAPQRYAARIAGIISAVKGGRVGNARWGRSMLGKLGGNVMRDHAMDHLRRISPIGRQAAAAARAGKKAQQARPPRQAGDQRPATWALAPRQLVPWPVEQLLEERAHQEMPRSFMGW